MGHLRLGRLPKTRRWRDVVDLLEAAPDDAATIAQATLTAAERRLREAGRDPSLTHAVWLLIRVTQAARTQDFQEVLQQMGLPSRPETSTFSFISAVADHLRHASATHTESGALAELASLAVRRTLSETVGQQGPSFFGSSLDDLQHALRQYSTEQQFGGVAQRFFGDFLSRTLTYYLDRELTNSLGGSATPRSITENLQTKEAVARHAHESARIMRDFAAEWYSKHNWQSRGQITEEETARFVGYALRKVRSELRAEATR